MVDYVERPRQFLIVIPRRSSEAYREGMVPYVHAHGPDRRRGLVTTPTNHKPAGLHAVDEELNWDIDIGRPVNPHGQLDWNGGIDSGFRSGEGDQMVGPGKAACGPNTHAGDIGRKNLAVAVRGCDQARFSLGLTGWGACGPKTHAGDIGRKDLAVRGRDQPRFSLGLGVDTRHRRRRDGTGGCRCDGYTV
jgi:hypothetical protein